MTASALMVRDVASTVRGRVTEVSASSQLVLAVAAADDATIESESLDVTVDGKPVPTREVRDHHGTRLHVVAAPGEGALEVRYAAAITGRASPPSVDEVDLIRYLRPSRYCEADRLAALAQSDFRFVAGRDLLDAVSSWVGQRLAYVAGSSRSIDGAVATYLAREGVCRDFAHLVIALLRACEVPARMVSVYAPGLEPMDFHAVCEAFIDGGWLTVDATCLAPRSSMVRIATGRDAADTAFLTSVGCQFELVDLEVVATAGELPADDLTCAVQLG